MITVKDIREKEFTKQKHGYHEDEVDEFLDEIADQLEMLIRENRTLSQQIDDLKAATAYEPPVMQRTYAPPQPAPEPTFHHEPRHGEVVGDEPSYFKNLETTLRETLISAQRIADETVADARKKAKQLVASAEDQSASILSAAKLEVEAAKAKNDEIHKAAEDYRTRFVRLVQEQMHLIKEDDTLFL